MSNLQNLIELSQNHFSTCSDSNFYVSHLDQTSWGCHNHYDSWSDFYNAWEIPKLDSSMNLLFRWDFVVINYDYIKLDYYCTIENSWDLEGLSKINIFLSNDELNNLDTNHIFNTKLKLYFVLQRKGVFKPVEIDNITEEDSDQIIHLLKDAKDSLMNYWQGL